MRIGSSAMGADLSAQFSLNRSFDKFTRAAVQLSTMKRINTGSDDPAGLMAAQAIHAELESLDRAARNATRAREMVSVADTGMEQTSELLTTIRGALMEVGGGMLGDSEVKAKQLEIDAAIDAVNRIGATTNYNGRDLLDGETLNFALTSDPGVRSELTLPEINAAALGGDSGTLNDLASGGSAAAEGGDLAQAMAIIDEASSQVMEARAEAGAFEKYAVDSAQRTTESMQVELSSALSEIADTNVAQAASEMVRAQVLIDAGVAALSFTLEQRENASSMIAMAGVGGFKGFGPFGRSPYF